MLLVKTASLVLTIIFSQSLCCTMIYLLYAVFCSKRIAFRPSLSIFYCRFIIDVFLTLSVSINKAYFLVISLFNQYAVKNLALILIIPSLMIATMRYTLGFLITFDRLLAIYFPISYHLHRQKVSIYFIIFILIFSAAFNQYVLFGYCGNSIDVPLECDDFKCTVNSCYYNYYLTQEQIVHFVIGAMTVILCARLFIMYLTAKSEVTKFLSQATRVALLDSLTIFTFFILPSFAYAQFPATDFEIFGPLLALFKRVGALIEAVFICRIFLREKNTAPNTISPMS
ncbi:G-protein coupled receptors family 1 profile domain-containing protein [Caenorhabditis elegans]|uniref:G-protein coupled receptors family 1 profile domain-containing protein n=1 Tax=Caenorhabditis elegans TaxID=6239 RepID=O45564_CAEEL|nr:G-protein coupled receptors family 1 profile domain-containing protein [Caenorhabditis elegans]CAB07628.2 G-protein coupled receptors family 1 profile domain-containing protein [Caenorhabditis elegans]|eukprot:NP_001023966.1 Serpentine Receptor, class BC (class B-like) [Caenorhabditis elegans]